MKAMLTVNAELIDKPPISIVEEKTMIEQAIQHGLDTLDVSYGDSAITKLAQYLVLLKEWNTTHNLTAITDIEAMVGLHILDSASVRPYLKGVDLLDVGSGAGLPGMVLAILSPALQVTSIESKGKKAQFQMYAANQLGLKNFTVEQERIENFTPASLFSNVISRAFSSIEQFIDISGHVISPNGKWLAMKGILDKNEMKVLKKRNMKYDTYALKVPTVEAQRNLVMINATK